MIFLRIIIRYNFFLNFFKKRTYSVFHKKKYFYEKKIKLDRKENGEIFCEL